MSYRDLYIRLLTELHYRYKDSQEVRLRLQDVLIELRNQAAAEQRLREEQMQDHGEAEANRIIQKRAV